MPVGVTNIYIYSNNGSTQLAQITVGHSPDVTATGIEDFWTYSGSGTFLGLSTSANATTPTYVVGDEIPVSLTSNTVNLYVVEKASTDAVTIEYNGTVIASLEAGQTATLFTKNKKMESDIMVTVPQSEPSETIKEYDGTIVISDKVDLITFTIYDTEYQAEKNMTWAQWCESEYNLQNDYFTFDAYTYNGTEVPAGIGYITSHNIVKYQDNSHVYSGDIIQANHRYIIYPIAGSMD